MNHEPEPGTPDVWNLYAKALAGELPAAEADALRRRAHDDPSVAAEADSAASTWHATAPAVTEASAQRAAIASTTDAAWARLQARAILGASGTGEPAGASSALPAPRTAAVDRRTPRIRSVRAQALRAGAVAAAGLVALMPLLYRVVRSATARTWQTYATTAGQRATIYLPDGSRVTLRGTSTLRVAGAPRSSLLAALALGRASADVRAVELQGEAHFVVSHDAAHPFRVLAGETVAEDLGTAFTVRAYPAEPQVRIVVSEGAVSVGHRVPGASAFDAVAQGTTLRPGDIALADASGAVTVTHTTTPASLSAWINDRLVYHDRPLAEVADDLALVFGAPLLLGDASLSGRRITLDMPATSLEAAAHAIAAALNLTVSRAGDGYAVRPNLRSPR